LISDSIIVTSLLLYVHPSQAQVIDLLAPAVPAQHQSDNQQAALADCLADVDAIISTYPIRRETYNLGRVGFHRIVEIRPDLDSRIGYPSSPISITTLLHYYSI